MADDSEQREPEPEREETIEDLDVPEDVAEETKGGGSDIFVKCE
jgi:hypothetical protein